MAIYFTADTHFFHKNIIEYAQRPFSNTEEMNNTLIENWNRKVKQDDFVYHLGDFSFYRGVEIIAPKLNGKIILVKGNHDKQKYRKLYYKFVEEMPLKIGRYNCYLKHRPILNDFYNSHHKHYLKLLEEYSFVVCGHKHQDWKQNGQNVNVGVDVWDYNPVHIDELIVFLDEIKNGHKRT